LAAIDAASLLLDPAKKRSGFSNIALSDRGQVNGLDGFHLTPILDEQSASLIPASGHF